MKKLIQTFSAAILLFSGLQSRAQVHVIDTAQAVVIGHVKKLVNGSSATITQTISKSDTAYTLWYKDAQHLGTQLSNQVTFTGGSEDLNALHSIFLSVFSQKNIANKSYSVFVLLGDTHVTISNYTSGRKVLAETRIGNGYFYLSKKQIDQLFGKG